jgi:hypothetical protein
MDFLSMATQEWDMNSSGYLHGRRRSRLVAGFVLMCTGLTGISQAVEFDEKLKAPMMKDAGALRGEAQSFAARYAEMKDGAAEKVIRSRALAREQFDLIWQVQKAIDTRKPLGDVAVLGLEPRSDGSYHIDYGKYPQWDRVDEKLAIVLSTYERDALIQILVNRGFTREETDKLRAYVATHDLKAELGRQKLPIAMSFWKVIKKYDKLRRPVTDAVVLSYIYQRERAGSELTRQWAQNLLDQLGPHGGRILLSFLEELQSTALWAPSDQVAGIADTLAIFRLPDFEQRAITEASMGTSKGETP